MNITKTKNNLFFLKRRKQYTYLDNGCCTWMLNIYIFLNTKHNIKCYALKKTELLPKAKPSQKQQNLDKNTNLFRKIKYQNKNSLSNFYVKFIQ